MIVVAALILVAGFIGVAAWNGRPRGVLFERRHRRLIVSLKSGSAFSGVLAEVDRESLVLQSAEAIEGSVKVDGELIVLRDDIEFIQRP